MPTVTIGENAGNTFAGTEDCQLDEFQPTTVVNGGDMILENMARTGPRTVGLIKFSGLSNITGPVTVSAATLYLYKYQDFPTFYAPTMRVRRLLRNWVESQATWNIYSTGNNWGTAGAQGDATDRIATPSATITSFGADLNVYHSIPLATADVEGFINGSFSNFGWSLEVTGPNTFDEYWRCMSSEGTAAQRPYLEVTYTAATSSILRQMLVNSEG